MSLSLVNTESQIQVKKFLKMKTNLEMNVKFVEIINYVINIILKSVMRHDEKRKLIKNS